MTTESFPLAPVPAEADLTDFKFMPLEVARLRRSKAWLICKRRPELAFFMLNLWTASWHERPAGSLEDDDDVLADAAMCSPEKWTKVRADVMRGWFKAADGRLYHPVVAEKVMDSWHGKAVARWSKECDRIRKENHKRKENQQPALDFPPKPGRNAAAIPPDGGGIPPENALKGEGREREGKGEERERKKEGESLPEERAHKPRSTRLAPEWSPSDPLKDWTKSAIRDAQAVGKVDPRAELEKFHDWWKQAPGSKGMKLDWDATWRTWIRKAIERSGIDGKAPTHGQRQGAGTSVARAAATLRRAALAFAEQPGDGEAGGRALDAAGGDPAEGNA